MNEQFVVILYKGILLRDKNGPTTNTYNMVKSQKHYVKCKKLDTHTKKKPDTKTVCYIKVHLHEILEKASGCQRIWEEEVDCKRASKGHGGYVSIHIY